LTPQDKSKPVPLSVKVHPKVLALAEELAAYLNDSSLDHAISEAIQEAGKDTEFRRWRETRIVPPIDKPGSGSKSKRIVRDLAVADGAA
jgi:hypothetical protein